MRILTASVALTAVVLCSNCTTLQRYPSFGTASGGRLIMYDRQAAPNLLPPANGPLRAHPAQVLRADRVH
jgi:hypothetical protein